MRKNKTGITSEKYYVSFRGSCPHVVEDMIKYVKDNGLIPSGYYFSQGIIALENMMLCKTKSEITDVYNEYLCILEFYTGTYEFIGLDFYDI